MCPLKTRGIQPGGCIFTVDYGTLTFLKMIQILRHANPQDIEGVPPDYRPLSSRGLRQCLQLRFLLRKEEFSPNLILHSPTSRTAATAFTSCDPTENCVILELPELFIPKGEDGEIIRNAFSVHKYNLPAYSKDRSVKDALDRWTELAKKAVFRANRLNGGRDVLIVTHAIFANRLAAKICSESKREYEPELFERPLGECDRFVINEKTVIYKSLLE